MKASRHAAAAVLAASYQALASSIRSDNGANCVGVASCRPRCLTLRIDRSVENCNEMTGAFVTSDNINPWDTKGFRTYNCQAAETCMNDRCGEPLPGDLMIRVAEEGYTGSYYHTFVDLSEDEDTFTFCSIYPCPKDECALPEQMGYELQIEIVDADVVQQHQLYDAGDGRMFLSPNYFSLGLEIVLKAAFVGEVLSQNQPTRYGPLEIIWMDDPSGCRGDDLPYYAPVAPPSDPHVLGVNAFLHVKDSLFCQGEEYRPAPLPIASPAPSHAPSASVAPSSTPTLSTVQISQIEGLRAFFSTVKMARQGQYHNWFPNDESIYPSNYCSWTGVVCNDDGFVTSIQLMNMGLSGSLPASSLSGLKRLQRLKLVGNAIKGPIPAVSSLKQLIQLELAVNDFTGTIPSDLGSSKKLRRILLGSNDLSGTINESLCLLNRTLNAFDISGNVMLEGTLPDCFGDLDLNVLRVDKIGLTGTIPSRLCKGGDMNGLTPNKFGCDAIACPANTYEPLTGRQTSIDTPCLPCKTPSNVIGSTICVMVDGNEVMTVAPTISPAPSSKTANKGTGGPSSSPVLVPLPTASPIEAPTASPLATPSSFVSVKPSPVLTTANTEAPTPSSSLFSVDFSLQLEFQDLIDNNTIVTFESVAQTFVKNTWVSDIRGLNLTIITATVLSQAMEDTRNSSIVVLGATSTSNSRRLDDAKKEESTDALAVKMRVEGTVEPYKPPVSFSFPDTVLFGFRNNMTLFMESLASASASFAPAPGTQPSAVNTTMVKNENRTLGVTIPLILLCCVVVAFFVFKKKRSSAVQAYERSTTTNGATPLSLMPSGSSIEEDFDEQLSPPPPPPHLCHSVDVHHCASSTCSCCNQSTSSSGVYFVQVENEQMPSTFQSSTQRTHGDLSNAIPFHRSIDEPSPRALSALSFEEDVASYASPYLYDHASEVEWDHNGGEI